jgi:hypothetical protein
MRKWRGIGATASLAITALLAGSPSTGETVEELHIAATPVGYEYSGEFTLTAPPVRNLYPSATKPLILTVKNPYPFAVQITNVRGEVSRTSNSKCKPGNVTVRPYVGTLPLTVPAKKRVSAGSLPLYMVPDAAQACVGVTFTIRMTGMAKKVGR